MNNVTIRPLQLEDAKTSYQWRNDPEIWKYTGSRPNVTITEEIELDWLRAKLKIDTEKRFAICTEKDIYIGNIQLTNIINGKGEYHIFIGDKNYWGKGYAYKASIELIKYAKYQLGLKQIYLMVNKNNVKAITLYKKLGFIEEFDNKMLLTL